jgi:Fic family protein
MIGYEHPFEDGNGRTARALFYWSMLNRGYWMAEFLSVSRILKKAPMKYARSFLYTESDDEDLTYFFLYHLNVIHRAIKDLDEYLVRKVAEVQEIRATLARQHREFNSRQLALLNNALRNPDSSYSVKSHMTSHRAAMETARQDLNGLEIAGLLERSRVGKRYVYRPAMDLAEKIRSLNS